MPQPSPNTRSQTLAVLGVALLLRLVVFWIVLARYPAGWLFTRGLEMGFLAKSLLDGQGLSSPFGVPTGPTAFIAPGYPILVAAVFRLFGIYSTASEVVLLLFHIGLNLLTIWLILDVTRKLFNPTAALVAGLFWACSIPLLWLPTIFWDTSLSICLITGLLALVLRFQQQALRFQQQALRFQQRVTKLTWISLGLYCGIAALINPALLLLLASMLLWLAWQTRRSSPAGILIAALTFAIVFSPWPIRNARVFHAFIPLRTTVGFELWMGNHPGSNGFLNESLFPYYNQQELALYRQQGEVAYTNNKALLANQYIAHHPGTFAVLTAKRIQRFWIGTGTQNGSALFTLHACLTTFLGLYGLYLLFKRGRAQLAWLFAFPLLLFPIPYYLTHAEFRYRLVIDTLLTILAAHALTASQPQPVTMPEPIPASLSR